MAIVTATAAKAKLSTDKRNGDRQEGPAQEATVQRAVTPLKTQKGRNIPAQKAPAPKVRKHETPGVGGARL